jgi:hypothetical protein
MGVSGSVGAVVVGSVGAVVGSVVGSGSVIKGSVTCGDVVRGSVTGGSWGFVAIFTHRTINPIKIAVKTQIVSTN